VPRLRSVPCVGPITAAAFLAAIDDAQRFRHAHQLEAYLGLGPREYSSGETQRRGAITKAGHSRTRWLLIQAAVSGAGDRMPVLRHSPSQEPLAQSSLFLTVEVISTPALSRGPSGAALAALGKRRDAKD
jgi:hypothetical protein